MAKTLRVETAIGAYSDYYLRLYTEETNISTVNNTSTVTVYLYGYTERASANCSWNNYGASSYTITINDGSNHSNTLSNQNVDTGYNETGWRESGGKLLHSYSYTVTHTTDGSKSINISASFTYAGGGSSLPAATYKVPASGTTTVALTKINRGATYSSCTGNKITSASGTLTININRNGTAYYQRLVSKIGSTTIKTQDLGTSSTSGTIAWSSLLAAMPSSTSKTLTVSIEAYSNSSYTTSVVTNTASIPITIDITSVKPTVSLGNIGINGTTSGDLTVLFSGKSKAQATWSTNTTNIKSTITSVSITGTNCSIASGGSATGGTEKSGTAVSAILPTITSSTSTIYFKMTVTDSRGAVATVTKSATAYKYAYPSLTVTAYRVEDMSSTTENAAGEYVYVAYSSTPGVTTGENAIKSYTVSPTSVNANPYHGSLSMNSTLTVTVTVRDKAGGTTTVSKTVSTALIPLDLYSASDGSKVGVGIGQIAESDKFSSTLNGFFGKSTDAASRYVQVNSNSGAIYLDAEGNESGNGIRGIWLNKHGDFDSGWLIHKNGSNGNVYVDQKTPVLLSGENNTWSGNITFAQLPKISNNSISFPRITFTSALNDNDESGGWGLWFSSNGNQAQLGARIYSYSSTDYKNLSYREDYWLPAVDADRTGNKNYYILTTKSPVAIDEGGTNATTAAAARTNLGVNQPAALSSAVTISGNSTGTLNITTANYKFYLFKFNCNNTVTTIFSTYAALSTSAQKYVISDGSSSPCPVLITRKTTGFTIKRDGSTSCTVALYYWN